MTRRTRVALALIGLVLVVISLAGPDVFACPRQPAARVYRLYCTHNLHLAARGHAMIARRAAWLLIFLGIFIIFLAGCAPAATPTSAPAEPLLNEPEKPAQPTATNAAAAPAPTQAAAEPTRPAEATQTGSAEEPSLQPTAAPMVEGRQVELEWPDACAWAIQM